MACAIIAISGVVAAWLAALTVGAALLAAAGCAALVRKRRLQTATPPVPEATVASVKADVDEINDELKNRTDDRPRNPAGDRTEPGATGSGSSGAALPRIRPVIGRHLDDKGLTRQRVLAAAIRLIDLGFFRPAGEEYAEGNDTFGLATISKDYVTVTRGQLVFDHAAKGAKHWEQAVAEDQVCAVVRTLLRRGPAACVPSRLSLAPCHRGGPR